MVQVLGISGVSPNSYDVAFESGYSGSFVFDFQTDSSDFVSLVVEGDLKDFVSLDKNRIRGREKVNISLDLPEELDGYNEIKIVAGDVVGLIRVFVSSEDDFVSLDLRAPDLNVGEIQEVDLKISNSGDPLNVSVGFEVYRVGSEANELVSSFDMSGGLLIEELNYSLDFSTINYSSGNYFISAIVGYNDNVIIENNSFRVGEEGVLIVNYTDSIRENEVSSFELVVSNFWNNKISDLYAEVVVLGSNYSFVTTSLDVSPFEEVALEGFVDGREIFGYDNELEVILHYNDEQLIKIVPFYVDKKFDFVLLFVVLIVISIVGIFIWRSVAFFRNIRGGDE